ncbi:hypothetical protein KI387_009203, partial [Taxus chinensis]
MNDTGKEESKDGISPFEGPYGSSFDLFKQPKVEADGPSKASAKPKFQPKARPKSLALKSSSTKVKKEKKSKDDVPELAKALKQEVTDQNLNVKDGDTAMEDVAEKVEEEFGFEVKDVDMDVKLEMPCEVKVKVKDADMDVKLEKPAAVKDDEGTLPAFSEPGEDKVVREIDVYFTPCIDRHTKLYLMQYPLRPYWRPYGLKERCKEVRAKPKQSRLEVDLVMDTEEETYDHDAMEHLKITKQLHLSPIHSIVQLRPLINYVNKGDEHKKKTIADEENETEPEEAKLELFPLKVQLKKETEWQEKLRLESYAYFKKRDEAEPWIPLEAHSFDSPVTDRIRQKIVAVNNFQIPFSMNKSDYVNTLVQGRTSAGSNEAKAKGDNNDGFSRSMDSIKPNMNDAVQGTKSEKVIKHGQVAGRGAENGDMSDRTMSEETRAALPGALREILFNRVCKLSQIVQSLQNLAKEKLLASRLNSKAVAAAAAASKGASAPEHELKRVIDQVATNMNGVYFLSSLGNKELDPFRNVVIGLICTKGTDRAIHKVEITEACKKALGNEVPKTVYNK